MTSDDTPSVTRSTPNGNSASSSPSSIACRVWQIYGMYGHCCNREVLHADEGPVRVRIWDDDKEVRGACAFDGRLTIDSEASTQAGGTEMAQSDLGSGQ